MKKFFSTFIHVIPADYELWLEKLAYHGWHPEKISQWSSIVMSFKEGDPKRYRYVLDIQPVPNDGYTEMYEQFGWELCGKMASTFLWRREYENERPESFSDADGLKERNRRFIAAISFSFFLFLIALMVLLIFFFNTRTSLEISGYVQYALGFVLLGALTLYLGATMLKIHRSNQQ